MARQFGFYSPVVPLGLTWEEPIVLEQADGTPVDLTGYAARAQLRTAVPARNPATGEGTSPPVLELVTPGFYALPPAWPVVEGFAIADPTDGTLVLTLAAADTWLASPTNAKRRLVWDIELVNPDTGVRIPIVSGTVTFQPRRSLG